MHPIKDIRSIDEESANEQREKNWDKLGINHIG